MKRYRPLLGGMLLSLLLAALVWAFSTGWSTHWDGGNGELGQWSRYNIGSCSGQNHSVSGSSVHMRANNGTRCFGAYYRRTLEWPGTFPTDQDVRVTWRWRYPEWGWFGTQAGQTTGMVWPQYYGVSAVDSTVANFAHVEADGTWGHWDVNSPIWRSGARDTSWHTSTFDFLCDGQQLAWWIDGGQILNLSGPAFPAGDHNRPNQFWFGNLLNDVGPQPGKDDWNGFDIDYIFVYAVERPQMNAPAPGSGGTQAVSWNAVSNTQQPDGSTWNVEYQVRACTDPNCSSVVATSPWQAGTGHTFTGLEVNRTYTYQARARWAGTPGLVTCWGNAVSAPMAGMPEIALAKSATAEAGSGEAVQYTLVAQNPGSGPASGVVVRDPIPQYILNPASISNGGSVQPALSSPGGSEVVWAIGTLNAGESRTLTWQGTIDLAISPGVTQVVNTASASDDAGHSDQAQATTAILSPDIALAKSATAQAGLGETVQYSLVVRNPGRAAARAVVARDPVPQYILNPASISGGGTVQGNEIVWNLGTLNPGENRTLTWQGTIDPVIPASVMQVVNTATAGDNAGHSAQAQATTAVLRPGLSVAKSAPAELKPGEPCVYTLSVTSTGSMALRQVVARDPIPQYILNPINIGGGGVVQGNEIVWNLGTLGPGESRTLAWQGTVDPAIPVGVTEIVNRAAVTTGPGLSGQAEAASVILQPAMLVVKTATSPVSPGGVITYQVLVNNRGNTVLYGVRVEDPLPPYVTPVAVADGGRVAPGRVVTQRVLRWENLGDIPPGMARVVSWQGMVDPLTPVGVTEIRNVATATTSGGLTEQGEALSVVLQPTMQVVKAATSPVAPGQVIDYRVVVSNTGNTPLYQVRVEDPLPPYVTPVAVDSSAGSGQATGGYEAPGRIVTQRVLRWENIGDLLPGASRSVSWQGRVDPLIPAGVTEIRNVANAATASGLTAQGEAISYLLPASLALEKRASAAVYAGGAIDYELRLTNLGPGPARFVVVRDPVPAHTGYVPDVAPTTVAYGQLEGDTVVWRLNGLAAGQSATLRWRAQVDVDAPAAVTAIANQAQAASLDTPDPVTATATTQLLDPGLVMHKACPAFAQAGDVLAYRLRVENAASGTVRDAVAREPLPAGLSYLPGSATGGGRLAGAEIVWELGTLAPGAAVDLAFALQTAPGLAADAIRSTTHLASADQPETERPCQTALAVPTLAITKSAPAQALANDVIEYTITVESTGPVIAHNTILTDTLPSGADYVPGSVSDSGEVSDGAIVTQRVLRWRLGDLAPGQQVTRRFRVQVHAPQGVRDAQVYNEAVAAADRAVPVRASTLTRVPRPVLRLAKNAPTTVKPGEAITYTLSGGNSGPGLARQAMLEDRLPEGLIVLENTLADGGYYAAERRAVVWPLGDLAAGVTVERSLAALVPLTMRPGSQVLRNIAFISSPDAAPVSAHVTTTVTGTFTVVGLKLATPYAGPGGRIDYAIQVHNGSPNLVANVIVRDPLPAYTTYITGSASLPPAFAGGGQTLVWNIGTLAAGEIYEIRFAARVADELPDWLDRAVNESQVAYSGGSFAVRAVTMLPGKQAPVQATATPASPTPTPHPSAPTATPSPPRPPVVALAAVTPTATAVPVALPGPRLTKSVSPAMVEAGQSATVTWTLVFSNPTPLVVGGVTLRDPLPAGLVYLDSRASQGSVEITGDVTQTVVIAHLGDVQGGGRAEITIRTLILSDTMGGTGPGLAARTSPGLAARTGYTNTASYSAANLDPGRSNPAAVVVKGASILPVTGGLLDPRTPQGKMAWGSFLAALVLPGTLVVFHRRSRTRTRR
jgi:uncharacterized repeat protein (TIGR01451 family)